MRTSTSKSCCPLCGPAAEYEVHRITVSILVSFVARGFGTIPDQLFCFSAISSGGVVLVLPGFTICK